MGRAGVVGLTVVAVAVGLVVARTRRAPAPPPPATHVIEIEGMAFHPADVDARVGDTLVWVNRDIVPHTASAVDSAWSSPPLGPGERWATVVRDTGWVAYACRFHPPMSGHVTVEGPDRR